MEYVTKILAGIEYCIPKENYDYYFTGMVIQWVAENSCKVDVLWMNKSFTIPISVTEAVDSIYVENDKDMLNELFKINDFPKREFLSHVPPPKYKIEKKKTFLQRLLSSK